MPSDGKRDRAVSADVESALNAYGFVGAWENDLHADRVYLSGSLIELMGIAPENAVCGVPLSVFLTGIHPDDRERVAELAHKAHVSLGRFAAQFRTVCADGSVRWVSARGQVDADGKGQGPRCIGMAVDITNARAGNCDAGRRIDVIESLVDNLISLKNILLEEDSSVLKMLVDMLLLELGKELSKEGFDITSKSLH
ncbi:MULTISPECIES: PAS domain-containing protein [unclassified Methylobacterium]|uniref:PAS domain-containing protein n=1 Tax=unclassified Methylobacterium TaxID=2615210 RepID=UPI0009E90433|nr:MULTISPECIES: PAS domain-containing protein [unclassified Methylobacterium]USU31149.1 PAS domain-containing protein [Methylobacterium sp. OTU13CASTA1]